MTKLPQLYYYNMGTDVVAFSSTRHGGCSKGNYAEFNINRYCGDKEDDIGRNRAALCEMLGIADNRLVMPHQVHLTKVVQIDEAFLSLPPAERKEALEGVDALTTNLSNVCIGVSTADCIPVLLYDHEHHALCAIHAGWRGTLQRIVMKAIKTMEDCFGTCPQQLAAQIGPGIHLDSFEVGDEVYEAFAKEGFDMSTISRRQKVWEGECCLEEEKWHINLPECNRLQLMHSGVEPLNVKVAPLCTFKHSADYFSARRLGINSGRIFTGIMSKGKH